VREQAATDRICDQAAVPDQRIAGAAKGVSSSSKAPGGPMSPLDGEVHWSTPSRNTANTFGQAAIQSNTPDSENNHAI
jgi:hypothetical protein